MSVISPWTIWTAETDLARENDYVNHWRCLIDWFSKMLCYYIKLSIKSHNVNTVTMMWKLYMVLCWAFAWQVFWIVQDTGLHYDHYLREVIDFLEKDEHFREKLRNTDMEDIKVTLFKFLFWLLLLSVYILSLCVPARQAGEGAGLCRSSHQDKAGWVKEAGGESAPDSD